VTYLHFQLMPPMLTGCNLQPYEDSSPQPFVCFRPPQNCAEQNMQLPPSLVYVSHNLGLLPKCATELSASQTTVPQHCEALNASSWISPYIHPPLWLWSHPDGILYSDMAPNILRARRIQSPPGSIFLQFIRSFHPLLTKVLLQTGVVNDNAILPVGGFG